MTRREMLVRMFGAAVAATVAPMIDLNDATPAFWNQPELKRLMPWRITFPNGVSYTFDAEVVAEHVTEDGNVSLSVRPSGPMKMEQSEPPEVVEDLTMLGPEGELGRAPIPTHGTVIKREGVVIGELQDIEPPSLERSDDTILGKLKRVGTMKFTVRFP